MTRLTRIGIDATIISSLKNGVGVYALNLVRELAKIDGIHLTVFVQRGMENLWPEIPTAKIELISGPASGKLSRLAYEQWNLPRLCAKTHVELLHSLNYTAPLCGLRCPSVVSVLDLTTFLFPQLRSFAYRSYMKTLVTRSIRQAARVIAISQSTAADLRRLFGLRAEQIDVSLLAFDAAVRRIKDDASIRLTLKKYGIAPPYFLYVGRLDACKNLVRLVEAFAALVAKENFLGDLVLAGRAWNDSAAIDRAIHRHNLSRRVHVTGHVSDAEANALYSGALAFAFPSLYEGFGIPILEAMACDLPVLTSNTSSLPEVGGEAALYVNPESISEIAGGLKQIAQDPALRDRLIGAGKLRLSQFRWQDTALATWAAYRKVLQRPPNPIDDPRRAGI